MSSQRQEKNFAVFKKLFRDIRLQVDVGLKLYKQRRTIVDGQFLDLYTELSLLIDPIESHQQELTERAPLFDFIQDDGTPVKANGYRSLLYVLKELLSHLLSHLQKHAKERGNVFYSPADSLSNITAYTRAMQGYELMTHYALELMNSSQAPLLHNQEMRKSLLSLTFTESACRDAFYGRCLGFQYSQGLKPILQLLSIAMASYEDWYKGTKEDPVKQLFNSLLKGGKYIQHPTQRGVKIAELTDDSSIYFAKAFWSITEQTAVKTAVKFVSQKVDICESLEVPAKNITIQTLQGEEITVTPPFSEIGYKPIPMRLISFKWREGQPCNSYGHKGPMSPPSPSLIIHFHGGGFVAQSSRSHEFYLRNWSRDLDFPILSVDYSLAPESPYPRGQDECVFAYVWALNNLKMLGTTGEKILLVGDSAGGCFTITTSMKIKQLGLRLPDQIFSFYPATVVSSTVSPSRFLSLIDPLMPVGILFSCLQAYTGSSPSDEIIALRKETRSKILRSKGYIIPSLDDPYVTTKPQTRWDKLKGGLQRSQTVPDSTEELDNTTPPKPAKPPLPPPPKITPTYKSPPKPKPSRPPPPKRATTVSGGPVSVSTTSVSFQPSEIKEDVVEKQEDKEKSIDEVETTEKSEEIQVPEKVEDTNERQEPKATGQNLIEVDLTKDPSSFFLSTPQTEPTAIPADLSNDENQDEQLIASSLAPFFHKQGDSGHRLGRRTPSKEELLTEEEITKMIDEIMKTYEDTEITKDPFISPALSPDDLLRGLPPVNLIVCSLDPLLDDGVMMAQRLKSLGQPVTLTVMENLSHGFLSLMGTDELAAAQNKCILMIKEALK